MSAALASTGPITRAEPRPLVAGGLLGLLIGPSALGVTAATVAMPQAGAAFAASPAAVAWPLTSYIACLALASAIAARLVATHGGRRVLLAGTFLLAIAAPP
jgi:MFS family permease